MAPSSHERPDSHPLTRLQTVDVRFAHSRGRHHYASHAAARHRTLDADLVVLQASRPWLADWRDREFGSLGRFHNLNTSMLAGNILIMGRARSGLVKYTMIARRPE